MESTFRILVVDDDIHSLNNFKLGLKKFPYFLELASGYHEAERKLESSHYHLLITDLKMPYKDGIELASFALDTNAVQDVILVTGYGDENSIERALKIGVKDFIRKPYQDAELFNSVERIYKNFLLMEENEELKRKLKMENELLREQVFKDFDDEYKIIGESKALKEQLHKASEIARYSEMCLIQGESGTGKELMAKYIHLNGPRKTEPFIAINCAELSPTLFESELFGFSKGAFTGAEGSKPGLFELANKGILFLDEISEIPNGLQAKLLRVIETKKIRRIGDNTWRDVDVQIIATTNRTLEELLSGNFLRNDLYHRLSGTIITLPPLRKRTEDIPLFIDYFINKYCNYYGKPIKQPEGELLDKIINFNWPGNIRQFSNFIKNYVLFGDINKPAEIDALLNNGSFMPKDGMTFRFSKGTIEELEEAKYWLVRKIMHKYNNNQSHAAKHLGMSYAGLHGLLKKIGMLDNNK